MTRLLNLLFGCPHEWSWPRTRWIERGAGLVPQTYQICTLCGREIDYDGALCPARETTGINCTRGGSR